MTSHPTRLVNESPNGFLNGLDLAGEFSGCIGGYACSHDRTRYAAGPSQGVLGQNKDVRDILHGSSKGMTRYEVCLWRTLSSKRRGRWSKFSRGSVSAVKTVQAKYII